MRVLLITLVSLLSAINSDAFSINSSPTCRTSTHRSAYPDSSAPDFASQTEDVLVNTKKKANNFMAAVALSWGVAASACFAANMDVSDTSSMVTTDSSSFHADTSLMVALSDKDFADFSLPSYSAALQSETNSSLKGEKFLLGEESKSWDTTTVKGSSASAPAAKESESAEEVKLDKAAAKEAKMARQKAAKEAQQVAIEAALAAAAAAKE